MPEFSLVGEELIFGAHYYDTQMMRVLRDSEWSPARMGSAYSRLRQLSRVFVVPHDWRFYTDPCSESALCVCCADSLKTHRYGSGVTMTAPATGHRYVYRYEMSSRRPEAAAASDFPVGRGYP